MTYVNTSPHCKPLFFIDHTERKNKDIPRKNPSTILIKRKEKCNARQESAPAAQIPELDGLEEGVGPLVDPQIP